MIKQYIKARLLETSTWNGIILVVCGVLGVQAAPELVTAGAQAVVSNLAFAFIAVGSIWSVTPDNLGGK